MKIGVLAVQGAFIEHIYMLQALGVEAVELRQRKDLEGLDGVILPGGESTVQCQLLCQLDMLAPLQDMIRNGLPVLATCAGMILLAETLDNDALPSLKTMPITVLRNAYGRQLGSFARTAPVTGIGDYPMVFIRSPYISSVGEGVEVLAEIDGHIVAARYQNQLALSFHPELTADGRLHRYFIEQMVTPCVL